MNSNEAWENNVITKKLDGTFVVIHQSGAGVHPYHVCSREIDPANAYDITEVAAFWEGLAEGDVRKQVEPEPEPVIEEASEPTDEEDSADMFILNSSGTYHYESCTHASESGQRLILENILLVNPSAKPCGTCQPPPVHTE